MDIASSLLVALVVFVLGGLVSLTWRDLARRLATIGVMFSASMVGQAQRRAMLAAHEDRLIDLERRVSRLEM